MPEGALRDSRTQLGGGLDARSVDLPGDSRSPAAARRLVRAAAEEWGAAHVVDDAALVVSELTTNAMLHARSGMRVVVERVPDGIRIAVLDRSTRPVAPRAPGLSAGTGRGTVLVDLVAEEWGVDRPPAALLAEGWAKEVWAVLRA